MESNETKTKELVLKLLNDIEVKGSKNLNNLLATIQLLNQMWQFPTEAKVEEAEQK